MPHTPPHLHTFVRGSDSDGKASPYAGVPASKSSISWRDLSTIAVVLGAALGSVLAVYYPAAAVFLGQTNQLVVVGFCLTVMAMSTARQTTLASIMFDVRSGRSSLQDFEALLRRDFWATHAGLRTKVIILLLTATPLALSVSYKRFVGGYSSIEISAPAGQFGYTMPPAFGRVGIGLALTVNQYLPYWLDAGINRTYGFSLYVPSNTTAAVLDTPYASYFSNLQAGVRGEDAMLVSAIVNATVTESAPFSHRDLTDRGWEELKGSFANWQEEDMHDVHSILWASSSKHNNSRTIVSIWDHRNQTVRGQARQLYTNRREAHGTWKITSSNITLQAAELLPETDQTRSWARQRIIMENVVYVDNTLLREFDYYRYPRPEAVDTTPALVAVQSASTIASIDRYRSMDEYSIWVCESDSKRGSVCAYMRADQDCRNTTKKAQR